MKSTIPLYLNLSQYKESSHSSNSQTQYKSKYVQKLLESDQSSSDDQTHPLNDQTNQIPPLLSINQFQKENVANRLNRLEERNIKYESFKMEGNELVKDEEYNMVRLNQMQIIPDRYELLKIEYEKLVKKREEERQVIEREEAEKEEEKLEYEKQIGFLEQRINEKDEELMEMKGKLKQTERQLHQTQQRMKKIDNQKAIQEQYGSKTQYQTIKKQTFQELHKHLLHIVQNFKNQLMDKKMSLPVEQIVDNFMTAIVTINSDIINTATPKLTKSRKPYHSIKSNYSTNTISEQIAQRNCRSQINRTPHKDEERDKSADLKQLQKSLTKLKEMEKSFMSGTPHKQQNFDSLDRSSLMIGDRSGRSKSRRKKIFQ